MNKEIIEKNKKLSKDVIRLRNENKILFHTLDNQNHQIENAKELNEQLHLTEERIENLEDAMFVILGTLNENEGKKINSDILHHMLSIISSVSINSIMNHPIQEEFYEQARSGAAIADNITDIQESLISGNHKIMNKVSITFLKENDENNL